MNTNVFDIASKLPPFAELPRFPTCSPRKAVIIAPDKPKIRNPIYRRVYRYVEPNRRLIYQRVIYGEITYISIGSIDFRANDDGASMYLLHGFG